MSILATGSVNEFFLEVVDDALKQRRVTATPTAKEYLVGLLADFARPSKTAGETLDRPLTLLLDEALHTPELGERFERLRTLGDGVLYSSGFFADHFEARGVDPRYVMGIGQRAYASAGSLLKTPTEGESTLEVFEELADKFGIFVGVVAEVADATIAKGVAGSRGVLKLYERWLKTGSDRLADALTTHGLVPTRAGRGMS